MKKLGFTVFSAAVFAVMMSFATTAFAADFVVADFDTGDKPNNIGGDFGSWDKDPSDDTQGANITFVEQDALGDDLGYSLKVDYDVDSPNPAYNGFWMRLNGLDATGYDTLSFYIKGDADAGFTKRLKIELKDGANKPAAYILSGVSGEWQKVSIPLSKFRRIQDWSSLSEFVLVFDDINSSPKAGTIYLDQVAFARS